MKTLLVIAYDFPPAVTGTKRTLKFLKYLPEFGWKCVVLTVKPVYSYAYDPILLKDATAQVEAIYRSGSLDPFRLRYILKKPGEIAQEELRVEEGSSSGHRTLMNLLRRWVFVPDDRMLWIPFAVMKVPGILKRHSIDALYTTSYPNSAHLVGLFVKRLYKFPWLADFRDGWSQYPQFRDPPTLLHSPLSKWMEKCVVRNADSVTAVSDPITTFLKTLDPAHQDKFITLPNGFDEEDFKEVQPRPAGKFTLTYTGTFFGTRTPEPFLRAVEEAINEKPGLAEDIEIRFICPKGSEPLERALGAVSEDTRERIVLKDFLPLKECLQELASSAVQLLILEKGPHTEIMLTQKVFEYFATGKPILALVPEGACKNLLQQSGVRDIVEPDDIASIKRAVLKMYALYKENNLQATPVDISRYTRRNLTQQLAGKLDEIT